MAEKCSSRKIHMNKVPTQGGVLAQCPIIALEALFGPPSIVSSLHDNVNLLIAVLTNIATENPAPAIAADWVSAVHRATPHVSDSICKHLWPSTWLTEEWVIRWDPILLLTGDTSIHINTEYFSQQSSPEKKSIGFIIIISIETLCALVANQGWLHESYFTSLYVYL